MKYQNSLRNYPYKLKIFFLGSEGKTQEEIVKYLNDNDNKITKINSKPKVNFISDNRFDYLISFGYRYIIKPEILKYFPEKAINMHISYLPWNRGADSNLWSIIENTIKGVTIHYINEFLDKGENLCQKEVVFDKNDTLKSTYNMLNDELVKLFKNNWPNIVTNRIIKKKQIGTGSYHKSSDKNSYKKFLKNGFETKISELLGLAKNA